MPIVIILSFVIWAVVGSPLKDIANMIWKSDAAPWETVDAYYYPHRYNLGHFIMQPGLENVDACRVWVFKQARSYNDSSIVQGDYECGIQKLENLNGLSVYRTTVK